MFFPNNFLPVHFFPQFWFRFEFRVKMGIVCYPNFVTYIRENINLFIVSAFWTFFTIKIWNGKNNLYRYICSIVTRSTPGLYLTPWSRFKIQISLQEFDNIWNLPENLQWDQVKVIDEKTTLKNLLTLSL